MQFVTTTHSGVGAQGDSGVCYLVPNSWDDFGYRTTFEVVLYDSAGVQHQVGAVRIARAGQQGGGTELPSSLFETLGDDYFSIGTNREYYVKLREEVPLPDRRAVLRGLRDCASDSEHFRLFKADKAMRVSLLRSVSEFDILQNFPRILAGATRLTRFDFSYVLEPDAPASSTGAAQALDFSVDPRSRPPSNMHVLIGRNGVGKTRILAGMANALTGNKATDYGLAGTFKFVTQAEQEGDFLNLVIVSFSAFDRFDPIPQGSERGEDEAIPYYYVGVKKLSPDGKGVEIKSPRDLDGDFEQAIDTISQDDERLERWVESLAILQSDPGLRDLGADDVIGDPSGEARGRIVRRVQSMSSGHKIVLLTLTRLIENVSERSLVLIDEPETHLHPPLLGSFMRAISALLARRNAVAIIATHSPVVLQEVPSQCAWVLRTSGERLSAERPDVETFAENVSTLTRKVFHLEVEQSGFYRHLKQAADGASFEDVDEAFGAQIGAEGRALLRAFTWKAS